MLQCIKRIAEQGSRPAVLAAAIGLGWLVLAAASCTVYLVADDWACLERIIVHSMAWSFDMAVPGRLFYRPLTQDVYYRVMHAAFGLNYVAYHVVNMLLRGLNILLVIKIGKKLSGRLEAGLWAGLLFVANPGSFLNVNFITGIQEIAQMLLSLTAVLCFISYESGRRPPAGDPANQVTGSPGGAGLPLLVIGPACYIVSLFCKESVVLAPVWLWIYDLARGLTVKRRVTHIIRSLMPPSAQGPYKVRFLSPHLFVNLEEIMRVAAHAFGLPGFAALDRYYIYLALAVAVGLALIAWAVRARKLPLPALLGIAWFGVNIAIFLPVTGRFYPYYISYALIGLFWATGHGLDRGFAYLGKNNVASGGGADTPVGPGAGDRSVPATGRVLFPLILAIIIGSSAWTYAREYRDNFIINLARATHVIHRDIKAAHPDFPPGARIIIFSDYRVHDASFFGLAPSMASPASRSFWRLRPTPSPGGTTPTYSSRGPALITPACTPSLTPGATALWRSTSAPTAPCPSPAKRRKDRKREKNINKDIQDVKDKFLSS
jgi:hypothetical protein